jgi:uncharacterized lipoprotein YmbA
MRRFALLGVALLAGCLGPRQDTSAFFLLSPVPPPAAEAPVPVAIGVGPVAIPGYLDRPQVVVRLSDNEIALSDADRWAEPLAANIARTLVENLAALLPGSSYVTFPWYASEEPDLALALEFRRFEADASGAVTLEATWSLARAGARVDGGTALIAEAADGPGRAAAVAAHSRALAELSRQIAVAVRRVGR